MTDSNKLKGLTVETFLALGKIKEIEDNLGKQATEQYDLVLVIETLRGLSHELLSANNISKEQALLWYREYCSQEGTQNACKIKI